jgi:hypothetical protein
MRGRMELNVTKMTFKGFRLGYSARRFLTREKLAEMQGKNTTPSTLPLFTKVIQNHKQHKQHKQHKRNKTKELNHG